MVLPLLKLILVGHNLTSLNQTLARSHWGRWRSRKSTQRKVGAGLRSQGMPDHALALYLNSRRLGASSSSSPTTGSGSSTKTTSARKKRSTVFATPGSSPMIDRKT